MQSYDQLTPRGQVRRLRRLAADALDAYGLHGPTFRLIANWENATFRVDVPSERRPFAYAAPFVPGRYLLRLHRPNERTLQHIESEFAWLEAIKEQAVVTAPIPMHTRTGRAAYQADNADYPGLGVAEGQRVCSLLRWVPGRILKAPQRRHEHMRRLGVTIARLHNHAADWKPAKPLDRFRWDLATIMGRNTGVGIAPDVWDELPAGEHDLHAKCEERLAAALDELGQGDDVFGLVHADLHLSNALFVAGEARPIDFDDAGYAHHLLDLAVTVLGFDPPAGPRPWQDALVAGYRSARPLTDDVLRYLDVFFAARQSTLLLWCRTNARDRVNFRAELPGLRDRFLPDIEARLAAG
ncbi:MAG: phosphotransferase [Phycisphaeraceae bacterium]|nr:phosphotransferase [Phycisphaeraceae bacterium]